MGSFWNVLEYLRPLTFSLFKGHLQNNLGEDLTVPEIIDKFRALFAPTLEALEKLERAVVTMEVARVSPLGEPSDGRRFLSELDMNAHFEL